MSAGDRLAILVGELRSFADQRDWTRFHTPKNLVMALGAEVGELTEQFMWLDPAQSETLSDERAEAVAAEVGDVMVYLLHLCQRLGIDPVEAALAKLEAARRKYPVEVFGQSRTEESGDR